MPSSKEFTMMFQLSATTSAQFNTAFSGAQQKISQLQTKISDLNKTQGNISAYQKQQAQIERTKNKLELLRQQYANLKKAQEESGKSDTDLQDKMLSKQQQIDKTSAALDQQTQKLNTMGNALNEAGVDTAHLAEESQRLGSELNGLRQEQQDVADAAQNSANNLTAAVEGMEQALVASGITEGLQAIFDALEQCTQQSIQFESAMAGVKRTVGGGDTFIGELGDRFKELSTQMPITTEELAGIATTAGQLGIAQDNVEQFTTVMAQLATTTDLTADDAATMAAQFANITGLTDYERFGSVVAELGDATATTASKVLEMSQGMAASASMAGMGVTDIMAIAASVGSLGIEAQAGSTAMSTLISTLYKAVETGDGLADFASVAGMTAEQFKTAWGEDAVGAMNAFIQGLNDTERNGRSAVVILDELGITNVRQTKAILGLANAGDLLSNTINQANNAWQQNTALGEKAGVMYGTTEAKLTMMQNAANNVQIAIGDALTPAIASLAEAATGILQPLSEWIAANPALVQGITAAVGVIGSATAAIVGLSAVMKVAGAVGALLTASIPGLPVIMGVVGGIGILTGVVTGLSSALGESGESFEELNEQFDDSMTEIDKQQHIIDLCEEYKQLNAELGNVSETASDMGGLNAALQVTATANASLRAADFMDANDPGVTITADQAADLTKAGFFLPGELQDNGDGTVTLTGEQARTLSLAGFFTENEVTENGDGTISITPEVGSKLYRANLFENGELALDGTGKVQLTAEQVKSLESKGFLRDGDDGKVLITPEPDTANLVPVDELITGDTTVTITPNLDADELQAQLTSLETQMNSVGSSLENAKSTLTTLQERYNTLKMEFWATNEEDEKSALSKEMETLNGLIDNQQEKVDTLQGTYTNLNAKYTETQSAMDEVAAKTERLAAVKAELAEANGGIITATEEETELYNQQVAALEALAQQKQAEMRQTMLDTITKQAGPYVQAIQSAAENTELLNQAEERQRQINGVMGDGLDATKAKLDEACVALENMYYSDGFDQNSEQVRALTDDIQNMIFALTGQNSQFKFSHNIADLLASARDAQVSYTGAETAIQSVNEEVGNYAQAVIDAGGVQQEFLDSLVAGVDQGGVSLEMLEGLLTESFSQYENGGEIVANTMDYVRSHITSAAGAAGDMADGVSEVSDATSNLELDTSAVVEQLDALDKAYQTAYDSALKSLDGQFDLFEKVGQIEISPQFVNKGDNSMREALQSQAQYFADYTELLEKAQQKGYDTDLLAAVADGTEESAAQLQRMVADSTSSDDVEALNESWRLVQQNKKAMADEMAQVQTDFDNTMKEIEQSLTDSVNNMDKSAEAQTNAHNTIQALVTEAESMQKPVYDAFKKIADQATAALATIHAPNPSTYTPEATVAGHAEGTNNAEKGVALVGEEGPELVYFNGGERVLDADTTAGMIHDVSGYTASFMPSGDGATYHIEFAPQYNISGSNAAEVRQVLQEHDDNMRAQLEDLLNDIEADRARRAYV